MSRRCTNLLVDKLQMSQGDLQRILLQTENTEREARRELSTASEEIAALRSAHAREIDDLERTIARKDREKRNLEEEMRDQADELSRERQTIRDLKVTPSHVCLGSALTLVATTRSAINTTHDPFCSTYGCPDSKHHPPSRDRASHTIGINHEG